MTDEQEHLEATLWGQNIRLGMVSLVPLLLIVLLGANTWMMVKHGQSVTKATDDAAQFIVKDAHDYLERQTAELRAENTQRSREHTDLVSLIHQVVTQQNTMFSDLIARKSVQDTQQHAALERAIAQRIK